MTALKLILARHRIWGSSRYWRARAVLGRLRFRRLALVHTLQHKQRDVSESSGVLKELLRRVCWNSFLAALIVVVLYWLPYAPFNTADLASEHVPFLRGIITHVRGVTSSASPQAYDSFLTTVAAVSGVFLALYFTALATVAGRVYAETVGPIRELVLRDQVGSFYVRVLSLLTAIATLLLVPRALGYEHSLPGVVLVGLMVAPAIFSFVVLSQHTFRLFDPSKMVPLILGKLLEVARDSTVEAPRWRESSFQAHNQRLAAGALEQLEHLLDYCAKQEHLRAAPMTRGSTAILYCIAPYLSLKPKVPTASYWFARAPEYKPTYLANSSAVEMADAAGTMVGPDMTPDNTWVERGLLGLSGRVLRRQLENDLPTNAYATINQAVEAFDELGRMWEVGLAIESVKDWSPSFVSYVTATTGPDSHGDGSDRMALSEAISRLPIALVLGYYKSFDSLSRTRLEERLNRVQWTRTGAIYRLGLPSTLLSQAEYSARGAQFEELAEGRTVSPTWYLLELMYLKAAQDVSRSASELASLPKDWYIPTVESLLQARAYEPAAIVVAGARQYLAKFASHALPAFQKHYQDFAADPINPDLPWPGFDLEGLTQEVRTAQQTIEDLEAGLIVHLSGTHRQPNIPDLFGQAVHHTGNAIMTCLLEAGHERFDKLFRPYLFGTLDLHSKLGDHLEEYRGETRVALQINPILDLLDVSGYALVMAEFHRTPSLWDSCKAVWDSYLSADTEPRLNWLHALLSYDRHSFGLTDRSVLRTRWKMAIEAKIGELPHRSRSQPSFSQRDAEPDHESALVRMMGGGPLGSFYDGKGVFVDLYMLEHPGREDQDFGSNGQVNDALKRRQERDPL